MQKRFKKKSVKHDLVSFFIVYESKRTKIIKEYQKMKLTPAKLSVSNYHFSVNEKCITKKLRGLLLIFTEVVTS